MDERPLVRLETAALVAVGGFAGATLRYLTGQAVAGLAGTLLVNVVGSFLLGFLVYEAELAGVLSKRGRVVLATGFLSSFTTYSTFALEIATAAPAVAVGYAAGSYALGFMAVLAGRALAGRVRPAEAGTDTEAAGTGAGAAEGGDR
jgi:CrcB protein